MPKNIKKEAKLIRDTSYLNKDFGGFRKDLLNYAKTHFSEQIRDFSEVSVGGMLVDMAAYVGDVMSFYLDHQYSELNLETAIEEPNVQRLIRQSGITITGASPAIVSATIYIRVDSAFDIKTQSYIPNHRQLPILKAGTKVASVDGTVFELTQDYDFAEKNLTNELISSVSTGNTDNNGTVLDYIVYRDCIFTSAISKTETFNISNEFIPFRTIDLAESDISEIVSVYDSENNHYYEVKSLTHDVVYRRFNNVKSDSDLVHDKLGIIPAPRRFTKEFSLLDGKTTIRFGSGRADTYEDDIVPDPSDHALPLYGNKRTFSRFSIDPNKMLETRTLGVSPINTTLTVTYRHGGGFGHNASPGQIINIVSLITKFNSAISATKVRNIRNSIEVYNESRASGGTDRPTLNEMRAVALNYQGSQDRIVTKQDLLTRVYTMPSNFGRVYRVAVRKNNFSQNTALVSILTKNELGYLDYATDTLKKNIAKYINEYRLIGDSIDILDGTILNYGIRFSITVDNRYNDSNVLVKVINKIKKFTRTENFQIDQPINLTDISLLIVSTDGVNTLNSLEVIERKGSVNDRLYSSNSFNIKESIVKGILYPVPGGMFELKYPNDDIQGRAI
mgnify:FL=1